MKIDEVQGWNCSYLCVIKLRQIFVIGQVNSAVESMACVVNDNCDTHTWQRAHFYSDFKLKGKRAPKKVGNVTHKISPPVADSLRFLLVTRHCRNDYVNDLE